MATIYGFLIKFFIFCFHMLTKKYINPYKLIMIFGKKGCGKTTTLTKLALKYRKQGREVYCTEKLAVDGVHLIKPNVIGFVCFPPESVILIDEVGMIWDSRNFKSFKTEVRDYFKLQRHYRNTVYMFSQTFDIDKKLRDLTDEMWLLVNMFRVFSYGKKISKKIVLNASTADSPSSIAENLEFDSLLLFALGSRMFTFIPKYVSKYDSYSLFSDLPDFKPTFTYIASPPSPKHYSPSIWLALGKCIVYDYLLLFLVYWNQGREVELQDYPSFTYRLDFKNPLLTILEYLEKIHVSFSLKRQNKKNKKSMK